MLLDNLIQFTRKISRSAPLVVPDSAVKNQFTQKIAKPATIQQYKVGLVLFYLEDRLSYRINRGY
jgi:hypothetical protein